MRCLFIVVVVSLMLVWANVTSGIAQSLFPELEASYGQSPIVRFDHLSLDQGLSQATVNAIVQDGLGFMWFGTQDGLNRFDGYTIEVYKRKPEDTNSISDNGIWCLLRDRDGDVWIGTMRGGLNRYSISTDKFTSYTHHPDNPQSICENNVISLFEDSRGAIWVGTLTKGLDRFDRLTGKFVHYGPEPEKHGGLLDSTVWALGEDKRGNLWVGTWTGLYKLPLGSEGVAPVAFTHYGHVESDPQSLSGDNVKALLVDRRGVLWVGTSGRGLNRYDERTNTFKHYRSNAGDPKSLSSDLVYSLFEDVGGNLWVGTGDGGLNLYNPRTDNFTVFRHDPGVPTSLNNDIIATVYGDKTGILWIGTGAGGVNWHDAKKNKFTLIHDDQKNPDGLEGNDVWAFAEDATGTLWVGTYGKGLNRHDPGTNRFIHYKHRQHDSRSLTHNNILSLCATRGGELWIGTEGGGLDRFDGTHERFMHYRKDPRNPNSIGGDEVTRILEDRAGDLWIGTNGFGVDRFDRTRNIFHHYRPQENDPTSLSGTSVMALYEDRRGSVWIGTWGGGVDRFDRKTDSFVRFQHNPDDPRSLNNNTVLCLYEDDEGALWMGTYGGGLNRYDATSRTFTHYTENDGLPNNVIYGILPDSKGNLWLSTNKGLSKFNLTTRLFENFDVKDGLQGNEFNQGAYLRSRDGKLFFGGIDGFNVFYPESIRVNPDIPPVVLTSFKVFDVPLPLQHSIAFTSSLHLLHDQNFFSIEFVALNFTAPEKNRYAYMLEGLDANWINAGSRRYASYTNLDPGTYTLRVKGSNNDGIWNERGVAMAIVITPPYWKTWWFRSLLVATVAALLFLMYRYRVQKLLEIERIRASIATDLHDDIGSTLTEIALFSDVGIREIRGLSSGKAVSGGELEKVSALLEDIGHTSRTLIDAMNDIVWAIDPKNDSFEYLLLRMKTHAARMMEAKGINYDIEIPAELAELKLPLGFRRRFFLIFKEAVNNIIKHAHPTKVKLSVTKEKGCLVMAIKDNGVGFDPHSAHNGNGLRNMQERAASLGGSLSIESDQVNGTTITLRATIP